MIYHIILVHFCRQVLFISLPKSDATPAENIDNIATYGLIFFICPCVMPTPVNTVRPFSKLRPLFKKSSGKGSGRYFYLWFAACPFSKFCPIAWIGKRIIASVLPRMESRLFLMVPFCTVNSWPAFKYIACNNSLFDPICLYMFPASTPSSTTSYLREAAL